MKKNYLLLSIGVIQCLYSLGCYIESFGIYKDEYGGVSISSNMLFLVWFICAVLFTVYCVLLVKEKSE